jgi:hypothetical protein
MMARRPQIRQNLRQSSQEVPAAQVDTESYAADFLLVTLAKIDKLWNEQRRKIVDAEKAVIFKSPNREAFTRSG